MELGFFSSVKGRFSLHSLADDRYAIFRSDLAGFNCLWQGERLEDAVHSFHALYEQHGRHGQSVAARIDSPVSVASN